VLIRLYKNVDVLRDVAGRRIAFGRAHHGEAQFDRVVGVVGLKQVAMVKIVGSNPRKGVSYGPNKILGGNLF
jgi:hypothetical protein